MKRYTTIHPNISE